MRPARTILIMQLSNSREDAGVYNINEGMCGVEVPSGTHEIVLKYETPYQNYGVGMTIIGIIIFILAFSQNLYKFFVKLC